MQAIRQGENQGGVTASWLDYKSSLIKKVSQAGSATLFFVSAAFASAGSYFIYHSFDYGELFLQGNYRNMIQCSAGVFSCILAKKAYESAALLLEKEQFFEAVCKSVSHQISLSRYEEALKLLDPDFIRLSIVPLAPHEIQRLEELRTSIAILIH